MIDYIAGAWRMAFLAAALSATAQVGLAASDTGPVTNLPMPRFVSMKAVEGNVRRGPSLSHRIDWVYRRKDLPLRITAEHGHWRRVQDRDGMGGWVHYSLLSGVRTVLVTAETATLRAEPQLMAAPKATLQAGVVGRLGACMPDWCRVRAGGYGGWLEKSSVWGVGPNELRD